MANLTEREQTLYECIAKGDFINAQNVLKGLLEMPKYGSDPKAKDILHTLEGGSISSAQDILYRYVRLFESLADDSSRLLDRSEEAESRGQMHIPSSIYDYVSIEPSSKIRTENWFSRSFEKQLTEDIRKSGKNASELARFDLRYLNSTLLYGLPGTGKTMFVRNLAKELDLPLVSIRSSRLISCRLGETGRTITSIFEFVRNTRCMFFIDEIDAFGARRGMDREIAEMSRITIALMQMMDTLPSGFIIIAATNRPDILDEALVRRFERKAEMKPFSFADTVSLIQHRLESIFPDFDMKRIRAALPQMDSYIPSRISGLLNHEIVMKWPEQPDLGEAFRPLRSEEKEKTI